MASSFFIKSLDPTHEPALEAIKRRFNTQTASRALSELLAHYLQDQERARQIKEHRDRLVELILDRRESLEMVATETKRAERADKDAQALAVGIQKDARQFRIDL